MQNLFCCTCLATQCRLVRQKQLSVTKASTSMFTTRTTPKQSNQWPRTCAKELRVYCFTEVRKIELDERPQHIDPSKTSKAALRVIAACRQLRDPILLHRPFQTLAVQSCQILDPGVSRGSMPMFTKTSGLSSTRRRLQNEGSVKSC